MTINSEFHANLQAGKVSEAISLLVSQLVEMDIVTALPADANGSHTLTTKVDLLSGRVVNEISTEFVNNPTYTKFLAFHTEQMSATSQLVREQLRGLQGLLEHKATGMLANKISAGVAEDAARASSPIKEGNPSFAQSLPSEQPVFLAEQPTVSTLPVPLPEPEAPPPKSRITATISPVVPETSPAAEPAISAVASKPAEPDLAELIPAPAVADHPESLVESLAPAEVPAPVPTAIMIERVTPQAKAKPAEPAPEPIVAPEPAPAEVTVRREQTVRGVSAAIASAGSPDISEASTIPNRFNQVLKSAGVREEEDTENPFAFDAETAEVEAPHPPANLDRELIDLLNDPDEQWDEWLLEDDSIFSELAQASQAATKDKIPEMDDNWFAPPAAKSDDSILEDWEKFIPEYTEPDPATSKSQANVERFRQNLVNDPQMMNELLAELDDIEQLGEVKPKSRRDQT